MKSLLLIVFLVSASITAGCIIETKKEITDDDRYLKALDDFSYENQWIWRTGTFQPYIANQPDNYTSKEQRFGGSLKIFAKTYYDKVYPLKVSSKFENSKTIFVQLMRHYEEIGDYILSPHFILEPDTTRSPEEILATARINVIGEDLKIYQKVIYDSNVCQESSNYPSISFVCNPNGK